MPRLDKTGPAPQGRAAEAAGEAASGAHEGPSSGIDPAFEAREATPAAGPAGALTGTGSGVPGAGRVSAPGNWGAGGEEERDQLLLERDRLLQELEEVYEEFSALLMSSRLERAVTYRELRELAYMGAKVLHDEAIFPVREANIPVCIKNTNRPEDPGTMIVQDADPITHKGNITGIAGKKGFTVIVVEKALMNAELGFGRRVLSVLEVNNISFEHMPSGIDTLSMVIADTELENKLESVVQEIKTECRPDAVDVYPNMALIATVGRGMAYTPGIASKLFTALSNKKINVRMIDQGSSEINIIVGVENDDFEDALRAIYTAFVG